MAKSKKNSVSSMRKSKRKVKDEYYREYLPTFFDTKVEDFNIKSRSINWGMGLEHEVQFFHINNKKSKVPFFDINASNIIFDSQESTCFLTKNTSQKGPCCKMTKKCYHNQEDAKELFRKYQSVATDDEKNFLNDIPWELSGRQQKGCTNPVLLKRIPVLMPEFVTENHKNRSIESLCNELLFKEKKFIDLQMKNPFTKEKVKKYGEIRQLPYGTISSVKVPIRPTMNNSSYKFEERDYIDYLGSYHVTMTLPCHDDISNEDFVELHRNFGKQVQMIEPLLIASFFSADPRSVGDGNKKIEGSFRVMATGWGNFGGSDLRELGKGVGRYANIDSHWRKGLKFEDTEELTKCNKEVYIDEPNAVGILSSDFRTFGFDYTDKCPGKECPKVSGAKMVYPYGVELRIFDHFNSYHLLSLVRILVYIAENSRIKECKKFIYNDSAWKTTLRDIMKQGWNTPISEKYLNLIRTNMGLDLNVKNENAFEVLKVLVKELFEKHKDGLYPTLMIKKKYTAPPEIPGINRFSWQIAFNKDYADKFSNFLENNLVKNKIVTKAKFEELFFKEFPKKLWQHDVDDVLYTFEVTPHKKLKLYKLNGEIMKIKRL
jgi:hypothetical protein